MKTILQITIGLLFGILIGLVIAQLNPFNGEKIAGVVLNKFAEGEGAKIQQKIQETAWQEIVKSLQSNGYQCSKINQ